jgi:formamidopyrimidine-DNA glycosylase
MPELPEVETVRRGLEPVLTGREIVRVDLRRSDLRWPFPERMAERMQGARVLRLRRRSKYILADLSSGETLILHLGMSGRVLVSHAEDERGALPVATSVHCHSAPLKHDHVVIDLDSGARVTFNDPRRFGAMDLAPTELAEQHRLLAGLGPEPLGNAFNGPYLVETLKSRNTPVKSALLYQSVVAGLGNIYVCEALHRARIAPTRKASRISAERVAALVPVIREVLQEAIEAGGSSLRDYRRTDGELGYFQHSFRVYGREGEACSRPGCGGVIARIVQSGRSSYYCPRCQR